MSDCTFFERMISDQHDSVDSGHNREALQQHLSDCPSCTEFQRSVIAMGERVHGLGQTRLDNTIKNTTMSSPGALLNRIWRLRIPVPAPLAAVFVFSAALGWMFHLADSQPQLRKHAQKHEQMLVSVVQLTPVSAHRVDLNK